MWLHARVRISPVRFLACCIAMLIASGLDAGHAQSLPGVDLPPGETVVDMAWSSEASLVLLAQVKDGYALRRLDLSTGDVAVIAIPKEFSYFKPGRDGKPSPSFVLSARGNSLAVIEAADGALTRSQIAAYSITAGTMVAINNRRIPSDFLPEHAAWDDAGKRLFISARPYVFPEQIYSVGMLNHDSGEFQGVVLKDNVDLIDRLVCIPGRDALAVRCAGYQGQYPEQPLLALIDLEKRTSHILHSQAGELAFSALDTGSLLVYPSATQKSTADDYWLLEPGAVSLRRAQLTFTDKPATLRISSDGAWYGFLEMESALTGKGDNNKQLLALQRAADGKTVVAATATQSFCFSPSGQRVCALAADEQRLYFYELPASDK